jgi:hypothetical protein
MTFQQLAVSVPKVRMTSPPPQHYFFMVVDLKYTNVSYLADWKLLYASFIESYGFHATTSPISPILLWNNKETG